MPVVVPSAPETRVTAAETTDDTDGYTTSTFTMSTVSSWPQSASTGATVDWKEKSSKTGSCLKIQIQLFHSTLDPGGVYEDLLWDVTQARMTHLDEEILPYVMAALKDGSEKGARTVEPPYTLTRVLETLAGHYKDTSSSVQNA